METERRISTGIDGLDEAIDYLRPGDTVVWQCEHISDYMYVATRFVTNVARKGDRIVYIRFADHEEIMDTAALRERGANVEKYELDPRVGFETFAVQVHRIIDKEPLGTFFVFDCLSDLQKYWFSDLMISNFFLLINPFLIRRQAVAYQPIDYEKHTYETMSRIRRETPLLANIRTLDGSVYIHAVKVRGRSTQTTYFPLKITGAKWRALTSSADNYAVFERFTQTGERRDCWDSMFDSVSDGHEPTDADGKLLKENMLRCLLGNEPTRLALCRKYFSMRDLLYIKNREIGTGCIGGKAAGMLLARNILRDEAPELYRTRVEPHDSYYIGADVFYTYGVQNGLWSSRIRMVEEADYLEYAQPIRELLLNGTFMPSIKEQFLSMLEYFGQSPIIVRSSSILEDGFGNAFAGRFMPAPSTRMPSATAPSASFLTATSRWRFWSCASAAMCTGIITTRTSRASAIPRTCISTGRTLRRRIKGCCGSCSAWARARSTARPTTMRGCSIWTTRRRRRWSPMATSISTRSIRWM